ncbi:MAG: dienelactone hydrolase [Paraburkholderia sp.]|nr:MAG: dienelactone hydrolase [Paraburkholderia sp.]
MRFLVALIVLFCLAGTPAVAANVGFEEVQIPDGDGPPLTAGIWYPTDAPATPNASDNGSRTAAPDASIAGNHLPLVVMSHGGGGWYDGHRDTALALAHAGFVAAAVSHDGDTFKDQSKALQLWRRPAQLHRLVDYMLREWRGHVQLDATRVGAFGFSNGGFTVLVSAGGTPDLSTIPSFCAVHSDHDLCETLQKAGVDPHSLPSVPASAWIHDPRVRAIVIAAPAFGFAFGPSGLASVHVPVQLWSASDDRHQPHPFYDEAVRDDLPRPPEYHAVRDAGHYDFLPPCDARLAKVRPEICSSLPGFDRAGFHIRFNADVVRFFRETLP